MQVEFVQVTNGVKGAGLCTVFAGVDLPQVTCNSQKPLPNGTTTIEAVYAGAFVIGSPTYGFLPSTSAPYTEHVGTSITTVRPGQTTITAGPCSYNCSLKVSGPASVPTPSRNLGGVADIGLIGHVGLVSAGHGTPVLNIAPSAPLSQPAATKIATTLQTTQTGYNTSLPSTVTKALPSTCGAAAVDAAIAHARTSPATPTSRTNTFLGPRISQVLASIYATHPTKADAEAFSEELALAHDNDDVLACTFARIALVDAFQLGRSTIAYQLGYKRLSQLDFAKVTLGSLHAHGKKGALLTVTPSTLGARILRLLEVAGLSHKVTITLTLTEEIHAHTHRSTRRIRVI
jgi:hypothetical protein